MSVDRWFSLFTRWKWISSVRRCQTLHPPVQTQFEGWLADRFSRWIIYYADCNGWIPEENQSHLERRFTKEGPKCGCCHFTRFLRCILDDSVCSLCITREIQCGWEWSIFRNHRMDGMGFMCIKSPRILSLLAFSFNNLWFSRVYPSFNCSCA